MSVTKRQNNQNNEKDDKEIIAIVESSTNQHEVNTRCLNKLIQLRKTKGINVLWSWYDNPRETNSWSKSKDADIIYIRYLKDSQFPIPRKKRISWWPLKFLSDKRYQQQQFDIYYAGRTFYGIDNSKFTLNDAKKLDEQILGRIFVNKTDDDEMCKSMIYILFRSDIFIIICILRYY